MPSFLTDQSGCRHWSAKRNLLVDFRLVEGPFRDGDDPRRKNCVVFAASQEFMRQRCPSHVNDVQRVRLPDSSFDEIKLDFTITGCLDIFYPDVASPHLVGVLAQLEKGANLVPGFGRIVRGRVDTSVCIEAIRSRSQFIDLRKR